MIDAFLIGALLGALLGGLIGGLIAMGCCYSDLGDGRG
jgi:hypothetical protein